MTHSRHRLALFFALLSALVLSACVSTSGVREAGSQGQAAQAAELLQQGHFAQAAQAYLAHASRDPAQAAHLRLQAARAWSLGGMADRVEQLLSGIQINQLEAQDVLQYDLLQAEVALGHGQAQRALQWANIEADDMPDAFRIRLARLRSRALAAQGQPWQAAVERARLAPLLEGAEREHNRQQILVLLSSLPAGALHQRAQTLDSSSPLRAWVTEALAQQGLAATRPAPELSQPVGTLLPGAMRGQGYRLPGQVAVVLPLSGPLQATGSAVLQGFFASYFQAGSNVTSLPQVRVYDSHGTAEGALTAYQQAVINGASVVVGPITRDGVTAVFEQPSLPVPTLTLNHPQDQVLPPLRATEFSMRPEVEARQAARHMRERGVDTAIVIVSSESFAQRAGEAFKAQFEAQGGVVRDMLTVNPQQVDYREQIATLNAGVPLKKVDDKVVVDTENLGWLATAGVFISMRPSQARLLLPQLHLARIQLPVFATSHVYGGRDNPVHDGDLNGVEFCDVPWLFDAQPGLVSRDRMAQQLPAARGASARLFAFGMDAWSLLPYLDWLRSHPGSYLPGATGSLSESGLGRIHRTLVWARFENGLAHPLAGNLDLGAPMTQPAGDPAHAASRSDGMP